MAALELSQLAALLQPLAAQPLEAATGAAAAQGDGAPPLQLSVEQARLIQEALAQAEAAVLGQAIGQAAQEEAAPQPTASEAGPQPEAPVPAAETAEVPQSSEGDDAGMEAEAPGLSTEQPALPSQEHSIATPAQTNQGYMPALDCFQRYAELFHKACSEAQASAISMPQVHVSMRLHDPAPAGTVGLAWCSEPARLRVPDIFTAGDIMALACIQAGGSLVPQAVFRKALRKEVDAATESVPALVNAQREFKVRMRDADPLSTVLDLARDGAEDGAALGSPEHPLELWVAVQPHGFGCLRTACGYVLKSANAGIRTSGVRGTRMSVRPPPSLMTSPSTRRTAAPAPVPRPAPMGTPMSVPIPGASMLPAARASATPSTALATPPTAAAAADHGSISMDDAVALAAAAVAAAATALGVPPAAVPTPAAPPAVQAVSTDIASLGVAPSAFPTASEPDVAQGVLESGHEQHAAHGGDDSEETEDESEPARKKARPEAAIQGGVKLETAVLPLQPAGDESGREASPQPANARPARRAKTNRKKFDTRDGSAQPDSADEGMYTGNAQQQGAQTGPSPGGRDEAADVDAAQALLSVREGRHPARMPGERRARVKYTDEEIHAILDGLLALTEQQRETAWATIKKNAGSVLAKRSNVDLKDKWRNLQLQWYKNELTPELAAKVQRVKAKTDHPGPWPEGMQW